MSERSRINAVALLIGASLIGLVVGVAVGFFALATTLYLSGA